MGKGQFSTPVKVVLGVVAILVVVVIIIAVTRPNLLGFSRAANQSINESIGGIQDFL
ncbi:MAG: hypothetical protein ABEI07_00895 [Candidatus Nanohaloarchaea archaeon]